MRQHCANDLCANGRSTAAPTRANGFAFLGSQRLENVGKCSDNCVHLDVSIKKNPNMIYISKRITLPK